MRRAVPDPRAGLFSRDLELDTATMVRLVYGMTLMLGVAAGAGCGWAVTPPRCDAGMARVDGQCVPKPTLVFRQCVEAFRTTRVQREHGDAVAVGGSVPGAGSARLERERKAHAGERVRAGLAL